LANDEGIGMLTVQATQKRNG